MIRNGAWVLSIALFAALVGSTAPVEAGVPREEVAAGAIQHGAASWYGKEFHGHRTASGEIYDMNQLTAAHPALPLGSRVLVTNLNNGRSVQVRVNDRGPVVAGRILDLSYAAARRLRAISDGEIPVLARAPE
jgi:rare lipoprotein A